MPENHIRHSLFETLKEKTNQFTSFLFIFI